VHETQQAELAAGLVSKLCIEHNLETEKLVVHSDNGAPMKGSTMLATMQSLGITPSFSRPSVSDDNAFAESLFRHLKYAPTYPRCGFANLDEARAWVARFVHWYNHDHLRSLLLTTAITVVTPPSWTNAAAPTRSRSSEIRAAGQPSRAPGSAQKRSR
jgi:transposase InsO family protein